MSPGGRWIRADKRRLAVVPNLDYVYHKQIAGLTTDTETQAALSRCRPPRWRGSESGFLSVGPDHFPETLPTPQVWSSFADAGGHKREVEILVISQGYKMHRWCGNYNQTLSYSISGNRCCKIRHQSPPYKSHQLHSCECDGCTAQGSHPKHWISKIISKKTDAVLQYDKE